MTSFVVHSSKTGNSKKQAESVCEHLPNGTILFPVDEPRIRSTNRQPLSLQKQQ